MARLALYDGLWPVWLRFDEECAEGISALSSYYITIHRLLMKKMSAKLASVPVFP